MKPEARMKSVGASARTGEAAAEPRSSDPAASAAAPPEKTSGATSSLLSHGKQPPSALTAAMIHLYRGEIGRSNAWRGRLDTTTNWAVLTAGATLSFAFSSPSNPHFVILISAVLIAFFLSIEARRYRYYDIWSSRVWLIERGFLAPLLSPEKAVRDEWSRHLTEDLSQPSFTISEWEALGRRLRRNYLSIFALLALSWNLKVYLHPHPARDLDEVIERAGVGTVPGYVVFMIATIFNAGVLILALATIRLREAKGTRVR